MDVGRNTLRHVEGVQGDVSCIIVGEQAAVDYALSVCFGNAEGSLNSCKLGGNGSLWISLEAGAVIVDDAKDDWNMCSTRITFRYGKLWRVDIVAILDDIASHGRKPYDG